MKITLTVVLPVAALLLCALLDAWLASSVEAPFVAAVAVVAWLCGTPYAVAATALSLFALEYFFVSPEASSFWSTQLVVKMALFVAANGVIIALIDQVFRSQAEWAEAEQRRRSLSELIPFGGWLADSAGNMISVSDSFLNAFKVSLDQMRGLGWLQVIADDQREQVRADWLLCMKSGYFWDYEYRMRATDGTEYMVLSRGVPVRQTDGNVRSWVGMHLDITELERSAQQRVEQARDIARFNAELEQFAYISSHDLQEPLRNITSYLQLLQRRYEGKLDADADTFINYAVEGAVRLKSLLQDLMLLQQIGKSSRSKSACPLDRVVSTAISRLQPEIKEKGATIRCDRLPEVLGDEPDLAQLFTNLLENAIKYSRDGVAPEIEVSATREGSMWNVSIRDNGVGIDAEYLERIFRIFQRLHPHGSSGTGIGLAICKKVVETHGGRIWAESQPGAGTVFRFSLPDAANFQTQLSG